MTEKEIEALAKKNAPLPEGATLAERLFYRNLRLLYREYREGTVDKVQAKREKGELVKQFGKEKLWEDCGQEQYERWRGFLRLASEAEKNG